MELWGLLNPAGEQGRRGYAPSTSPSSWGPSGCAGLASPHQSGSCSVSRGWGLGLLRPGGNLRTPPLYMGRQAGVSTPACPHNCS